MDKLSDFLSGDRKFKSHWGRLFPSARRPENHGNIIGLIVETRAIFARFESQRLHLRGSVTTRTQLPRVLL